MRVWAMDDLPLCDCEAAVHPGRPHEKRCMRWRAMMEVGIGEGSGQLTDRATDRCGPRGQNPPLLEVRQSKPEPVEVVPVAAKSLEANRDRVGAGEKSWETRRARQAAADVGSGSGGAASPGGSARELPFVVPWPIKGKSNWRADVRWVYEQMALVVVERSAAGV